jgi:hypothetical protein
VAAIRRMATGHPTQKIGIATIAPNPSTAAARKMPFQSGTFRL